MKKTMAILGILGLLLLGCGEETTTAPPILIDGDATVSPETGLLDTHPQDVVVPDIVPDVPEEIQPDIVPDVPEDVQPDIVPDVPEDIQPDIVPDVPEDIQPDIVPDIQPDEVMDTIPDEVEDTSPDTEPDVVDDCNGLCGVDETCCDGTCVDTSVDSANCGFCGVDCLALGTAYSGVCENYTCLVCENFTQNCDGSLGCDTEILTDINNCGGCGDTCDEGYTCVGGGCTCGNDGVCDTGESCCWDDTDDWHCTDTDSDPMHCGACEDPCPSDLPICDIGECYCTCGDGIYDAGEEYFCPADFTYTAVEGDGYCDRTVEFADSPDCVDFNYTCGDNTCSPSDGEHLLNCSDCGANTACGIDGDGDGDVCDSWKENCDNCPLDCGDNPLCQTSCGS